VIEPVDNGQSDVGDHDADDEGGLVCLDDASWAVTLFFPNETCLNKDVFA
jgi:hypothetical protein